LFSKKGDLEVKKIIFMGTPSYATEILKALLEHYQVVSVFTQPDRPVGRKRVLTPPDVKAYILEHAIDVAVYQPETLRDVQTVALIKECKPDFIVVAAYGQILPVSVLEIAPCINLHASLLPRYRGASPIQSQILGEDRYVGITSMLMAEGLDTGDILGYRVYKQGDESVNEMFMKMSHDAAKLAVKTIESFEDLAPMRQRDMLSSYAKKIKRDDGVIEFNSAREVHTKHRAYKGWPEVFLSNGFKLKKLALEETQSKNRAGEIKEIGQDSIVIGCKRGSIRVYEVQAKSKKAMEAVQYIRGQRLEVGSVIS
jgi:methionyl-tRNA formyltransferase